MADLIGRDIVVDTEEWDNLVNELENKDQLIKEMLDEFIETLDLLVNEGFIRGTRHDNMAIFTTEVKNLRSQLNDICDSAKSAVNDLKENTESEDQYISIFHLGG